MASKQSEPSEPGPRRGARPSRPAGASRKAGSDLSGPGREAARGAPAPEVVAESSRPPLARAPLARAPLARARGPAQGAGGHEATAEASATLGPASVDVDWRELFAGRSSSEILARLVADDPLDLRTRVARHLREQAWLLAADRVLLRALARCAHDAPHYRGAPALPEWLELAIDAAVLDLCAEDCEAELEDREPEAQELAAYVALAEPLGLAPAAMRRVCIAFNRLAADERRAFQTWVVEGRALDDAARRLGLSEGLVAERARRVLELVLAAGDPADDPRSKPPLPAGGHNTR